MSKIMLQSGMLLILLQSSIMLSMDPPGGIFPAKLNLDALVPVISYCSEQDWARLRKACKWFARNLSIKTPSLKIIQHPLFHVDQETAQCLAFNVAWNGNFEHLIIMIKHLQQIDYKYTYPIPYIQPFSHFDLLSIIKAKMPDKQEQISGEAKKNKCDLGHYNVGIENCTAMKMACYNRESDELEKHTLPDIASLEWKHLLGIAIGRGADVCVNVLCKRAVETKVKDRNFDEALKDNEYYQAVLVPVKKERALYFLEMLQLTMRSDNYNAFEIITKSDLFECLNFRFEYIKMGRVTNYKTVLDRLIFMSQGKPAQQKYIDIYKKCGGKTNKELEQEKCIIS